MTRFVKKSAEHAIINAWEVVDDLTSVKDIPNVLI